MTVVRASDGRRAAVGVLASCAHAQYGVSRIGGEVPRRPDRWLRSHRRAAPHPCVPTITLIYTNNSNNNIIIREVHYYNYNFHHCGDNAIINDPLPLSGQTGRRRRVILSDTPTRPIVEITRRTSTKNQSATTRCVVRETRCGNWSVCGGLMHSDTRARALVIVVVDFEPISDTLRRCILRTPLQSRSNVAA